MRMRKLVALAGVLVGLAATQPASAEQTTVGANTGLAGFVASTSEEAESRSPGGGFRVSGECKFAGVLTPASTLIINYAGAAVATGPVQQTVPLLTAVGCKIKNASGNTQHKDIALNGPAAATADSTLLATSGPKEWPVEDVTVCVSAFAVWGPTPVTVKVLAEVCVTP